MNISDLLDRYVFYLSSDRRLSSRSVKSYRNEIEKFLRESLTTEINTLTLEKISLHREILIHKNIKNSSKNVMLIALKSFLKYARVEFPFLPDPNAFELFSQKGESPRVSVPTDKQLLLFVSTKIDPRDDALVEFLFCSGLRIAEALSLKVKDFGREISLIGKGQKKRLVFVSERVHKIVLDYLTSRNAEPDEPLFTSSLSNTETVPYISVNKMFKIRSQKLGIFPTISPHKLRHAYATLLLRRGARIEVVQKLLGHSSILTTMRYSHLVDNTLREEYTKHFTPGV